MKIAKPTINMVPFIDIMLVLLAIVLTTSSFIASGRIPVNLPQASAAPPAEQKPPQIIEIDASGQAYREGTAVSLGQLRQQLASVGKDTQVLLRADKAVQLQHFIDVADLLKQVGLTRVAVQTQTVSGGPGHATSP